VYATKVVDDAIINEVPTKNVADEPILEKTNEVIPSTQSEPMSKQSETS